jgi:C4-dicarboxylate-specific signal transduction histidine kinase
MLSAAVTGTASRAAKLALSIQSELPDVSIDRLRIQHVLFALIQNALEAPTRQGCARAALSSVLHHEGRAR